MDIELNPAKGVHILHSDCPAQVCVHTGWIKNIGETIICLPNKVLLEIKGDEEGEYNAIAY
ncbi:MAG: NusG domain II-containing protein [Planctomycetes bacterium]|nr:NusG domain II-containing protein [Planctomycetota bacterium]